MLLFQNVAFVSRSQLRFSPFFLVRVEIPGSADEQHQYESPSIVVVAFIYIFFLCYFFYILGLRTDEGGLHRTESTLRTIK